MGNFYVNITLNGPKQKELVDKLKSLHRTAFVSPTVNNTTTVYDAECDTQDTNAISKLSKKLSSNFSCPAWAVLNHDDDVLAWELYENGKLIDEYDSSPGNFESNAEPATPIGGDSEALVRLLSSAGVVAEVEKIIRTSSFDSDGFVFAYERHQALADKLGLPKFVVGFGYNYISAGELPLGFKKDDFIEI